MIQTDRGSGPETARVPDTWESRTVIVCHCRRVTDRQIRQAVREGAECIGSVAAACGAAAGCGGCATVVHDIVCRERDVEGVETITSPLLAAT